MLKAGLLVTFFAAFVACSSGSDDSNDLIPSAAGAGDGGNGGSADADSDAGSVFDGGPAIALCAATPPAAGAAIIFQAPSPVMAGETALLFGAAVGADANVYGLRLPDGATGNPPSLADCVPASAARLPIVQASDLSVKATIPSAWGAGTYALVVETAKGRGKPVVLNRARIDWVRGGSGGAVVAGASVDVFGRSFGASPHAWLVDDAGTTTALGAASGTSDGYAATFSVPALSPGRYSLYVHSGAGGGYGFSEPLAVKVVAPAPWPTEVFSVAASTANDDAALATALTAAHANGGGVVELATGSYTLKNSVIIPAKTVIRSQSGHRGDVTITFDVDGNFPSGFITDGYAALQSITVQSNKAARLFQCPSGSDFMRDPSTGEPQYQPDPPCASVTIHDATLSLTTLRNLYTGGQQTTTPTSTIMVVINGDDSEISDSTLTNTGGSAMTLAKGSRYKIWNDVLVSGTTRVAPDHPLPYDDAQTSVGGGCGLHSIRESIIAKNTIGPTPVLGAGATMYIEEDAHDLYIADNTIGPNLSNYGEGFSFDAPYYPNFVGIPKTISGRAITIPRVLNGAGKNVFAGASDGSWTANTGGILRPANGVSTLVGNTVVVVGGTGLGEYAEVSSHAATSADGSTTLMLDRDFPVALDATSVLEVAISKSQVVFARNAFHEVAVGAQLYAGGYDFLIDGTSGSAMEGSYCNTNDAMTSRGGSATDLQRRFTRCYFNQWIHTSLTSAIAASYPWAQPGVHGVYRPFTNGLIGVGVGVGDDPLQPSHRGIGAVGNIVRDNAVTGYTFGFVQSGNNVVATTYGRDGVVENNGTKAVPVGVMVDSHFATTWIGSNNTCSGCTTNIDDESDSGL